MLSLKLPINLHRKQAGSYSASQESILFSSSCSIIHKTAKCKFFPDKKYQQISKGLVIRQAPNLKPYQLISASALIEKKKFGTKQASNNQKDLLNITDSFQYRCTGLLDDASTSNYTISNVRRKSDASLWSGGFSILEKKIGSLTQESLLARNRKIVVPPKSNSNSPSKFRSSVKRALATRDVTKVSELKRAGTIREFKEGRDRKLFNRSNSTIGANESPHRHGSVRREEVSQEFSNLENQDGFELLKLGKLNEVVSEEQEVQFKIETTKEKNLVKSQKSLTNIVKASAISKKSEKNLFRQISHGKITLRSRKSVEKIRISGNKRTIKVDNEKIALKKKTADKKEETKKIEGVEDINNSLDEKLGDTENTETSETKQESLIIEKYRSIGELNEFAFRKLPVIKEERAIKSQTDKLEKIFKNESKKVHSLALTPEIDQKNTTRTGKYYFNLGYKQISQRRSTTKLTQSIKMDNSADINNITKEVSRTGAQIKTKDSQILRRLYTPKISSTKQIIMAYSMSNITSPQA